MDIFGYLRNDAPLWALEITVGTYNALKGSGIGNVGELRAAIDKAGGVRGLTHIRGLGQKRLKELESVASGEFSRSGRIRQWFSDEPQWVQNNWFPKWDVIEKTLPYLSTKQSIVLTSKIRDGKTLEEIGQDLGVTRERVRQIYQSGAMDALAIISVWVTE